MRRWFTPTLTLCLLLTLASLVLAQTPSFTPSPYVYRIVINGCAQPPLERTQTGFRVKDATRVGIVTALHGVAGCQTINAIADGASAPLLDLTITQVDIARDVALLGSQQLDALPLDGLVSELETTESTYAELKIIGYHSGIARQAPPEAVTLREVTDLVDLVPDALLRALNKRRSQALDIHVLNINGNLLPGHSGAPLLNGDGQVVGVGNGGIDLGRVGWGWAIPWQDISWKTVGPAGAAEISAADIKRLAELPESNPQLVFSFSTPAIATATPTPTRVTTPTRAKSSIKIMGAGAARNIGLVALPGFDQR